MQFVTPWDLIKSYRKKSAFFFYLRYLFLLILILLIPFGLLIYYYYGFVFQNAVAQYSSSNLIKSTELFEVLISDFDEGYRSVSQNPYFHRFLSMNKEATADEGYLVGLSQSVRSMKRGLIRNIYLYSFSADYVISSEMHGPAPSFSHSMWLKTYRATSAKNYIIPRKVFSEDYDTIYLCRQVVQKSRLTGLFCLELDYRDFIDIVHKSFSDISDRLCIVSDIGVILYSEDPSLINVPIYQNKELEDIYERFRGQSSGILTRGELVISTVTSKNNQLLLISFLNKKQLNA